MIQVGLSERTIFPLIELLIEGNIDRVNKIIFKRGIPYSLDSLEWEIFDAPAPIGPPVPVFPIEGTTPENNEINIGQ